MNHLNKLFLFATSFLFLIVFASTSFAQFPTTPTDGVAGVSQATATVSWTAFDDDVSGYDVEYNGTDNTYVTSVSSSSQPGTSFAIGPLVFGTTYYWRVRDADILGSSGAWNQYSFTTELAAPVATDETSVGTTSFTANWNAVPGATKYLLDVDTDNGFGTATTYDAGTATFYSVTGLTENTHYYYRVRAEFGPGGANGTSGNSNTIDLYTLPTAPTLLAPTNTETGVALNANLTWSAKASPVDKYYLEIRDQPPNGGTVVFEGDVGNVTTFDISTVPLDINTTYYWRIQAHNPQTWGPYSAAFSFTTIAAPTLSAPVNGLTGVSIEPNFTWTDVDGELSYELRISTADTDTSTFNAAVVLTKTGLSANSVAYQLLETDITSPPFANNTKFYWMISARDAGGNKINSEIYHYTTYPDLSPTLLWPSDGITISGDDITFSWYISTPVGGLSFYVQYIQQTAAPDASDWAGGSTVNLASTTDLFKAIGSSIVGGLDYHWRVIVKDGSDIVDYSAVNSFTTNGGTSVTITPSWPVGGVTVYSNNPTLNWYPSLYVPGLKYEVRYALTSAVDGGTGALNDGSEVDLALTTDLFTDFPSDLTPGTPYYWQVRVYDPSATTYGPYSSVASFETNGSGTLVVPTPSFPLGEVTVYTAQPTFSWYTGTSGLGLTYDLEVKELGDNFNGTVTYNNVDALFKLSDPLTPGLSYHWRVRSDNGTDQSDWSTAVVTGGAKFSVSGGITTALPVAIWPVGNVSILSTTPTLSWTVPGSVLGITGYVVKYKKDSAPTWSSFSPGVPDETDGEISVSGGTTLFKELTTALDFGGHYYWAVASVDATGESSYSQGEFTITGGTGSGQPTLLAPGDASVVYNKKPTFSWYVPGSSNGITGYELVYSTSDVFAAPVTTTETTTATEFTPVSDLTPGATYFWKVRSTYASLPESAYSSTFYFTVNPGAAPIQPIVGGPSDNLVVPTSEPTLAWKVGAQPNATMTYELEIADNINMDNSNVISDINTTYQKVTGLSNDQSYYWRVRSKNADGSYSNYSGKGKFYAKFSVTGVDDVNIVPKEYSVAQNYPNPFNPTTTIRFALPEASFVTLKIYNMLGQEVKTLVNEQKSAGTFNVQWKGDNDFGSKVSSGTYIYRVVAGANIFTKKMILLK